MWVEVNEEKFDCRHTYIQSDITARDLKYRLKGVYSTLARGEIRRVAVKPLYTYKLAITNIAAACKSPLAWRIHTQARTDFDSQVERD